MVGKAKSNHSLSATIDYNLKKDSVMFYTNNLKGENISDYRLQMTDLQKCYNGTGNRLTLHAQLSPTIEDGQKLSMGDWQKMSKTFIDKMGLTNHQVIAFLHTDKNHSHAHYVISRVNEADLKLYSDSYLGIKAGKVADGIAQEMGLTRAKEIGEARRREKELEVDKPQPSIEKPIGSKQIFKAFLERMNTRQYKDLASYLKAIELEGYIVKLHKDKKTNLPRGYGIEKDGTYLDASAIDRKFTIKNLLFGSNAQTVVIVNKEITPTKALIENTPTETRNENEALDFKRKGFGLRM